MKKGPTRSYMTFSETEKNWSRFSLLRLQIVLTTRDNSFTRNIDGILWNATLLQCFLMLLASKCYT